ncbi:MAG: VCBS repeat-containing protein, partial [Planctomycetes bacterium]|nr:VCBS repeat-containing protein [Planctomycetota bacterium]
MRPLLALGLLAAPLPAQEAVLWSLGESPGDRLGACVAACGDVDGDGFPDWIVGVPKADANGPNSGSALVYSGLSGGLLLRFDGAASGVELGSAVGGAGDVNGDGHDDLIVGAPRRSVGFLSNGEALVFSGADGTVLHTITGTHQFGFTGSAVAGAGDVDGDGKSDFLVATPYADTNGIDSGEVEVYSGQSGALIRAHSGDTPGAHYGSALAGGRDVNGDGRCDYLVGAPADGTNGTDAGIAKLYSGLDGSALGYQLGTTGDRLGACVAFLGDLDQNGRDEYGFGAPGFGGGAGAVYVRDDAGAPLFSAFGTSTEGLGSSLAAAGQPLGDGTHCVLVGAPLAGGGGRALLLTASGAVAGDLPRPSQAASFGTSVPSDFDANGDGRDELL